MLYFYKPKGLCAAIVFFLLAGLAGCGGSDDSSSSTSANSTTFTPGTYPRFDPSTSDVPFNTDLVFAKAAATDGTADVGAADNPISAAINVLDGFSPTAYFDILIHGSVDASTVIPGKSVFVVRLDTGGKDALDPANVAGVAGMADFDAVVTSLDGGTNNAIRIRPLTPLAAKSKYLVFLTNAIKDTDGQPLTASQSYHDLGNPFKTIPEDLQPVRTAIKSWNLLASSVLSKASDGAITPQMATDKLILSYTFTTTDPQAALMAMASPRAAIAQMQIAKGVSAQTALANANNLQSAHLLPTPKARPLGLSPLTGVDIGQLTQGALASNVAKLYTGYITLPYYQTAPGSLPFGAFLQRNWRPDMTLADALNVDVPKDVDGSYNVTYRYPFAKKTSDQTVPLQVTLPDPAVVPGYAESLNCGQIYASKGYPLVFFIHGITSDRTSVVALAHTLANQCIATVAIDLPLHGVPANSDFVNVLNVEHSSMIPFASIYGSNAPHERHFNVAGAPGDPSPMNFTNPTANDGSGAQFINLGYLANTRDNNRQGVMDLLNLSASLGDVNTAVKNNLSSLGFDLNSVYVEGVSLGGILGTVFADVNQQAIANDKTLSLTSNLTPIKGVVLSSAGSQVVPIITQSKTFGPIINAGLAAKGLEADTTNYERFLYAAQSIVGSGDAVNYAQALAQQDIPVLLQEVADDQVIPNVIDKAPLGGIEALGTLLNATQLGLGETQLGLGRVKMNAGGHTSLLRPSADAPQVTPELQAQVASFVLNKGKVAVGSQAPNNVEAAAE